MSKESTSPDPKTSAGTSATGGPEKNPKKRRLWVTLAVAAALLVALVGLAYLLVPRVTIAGFAINQTRSDLWRFTAKFAVQNRLPVDIRLGGYSFKLEINGESVAEKSDRTPVEIPGWEVTHLPVWVEGREQDMPDWLQLGRRQAPARRDYDYKLSGWIEITRPIKHHYEFIYQGTVPAFAAPDFVISAIRVAKFDLFNPEVDITLEMSNPNGFKVTHEQFVSDVVINGIPVGKIDKPEQITYEAFATKHETFHFRMESIRGGAAAVKILLSGGRVEARMHGSVLVHIEGLGTFPFEFDSEAPAPVDLGSFQQLGFPQLQQQP